MVDALDSGSSGLMPVGVRVPPFAQRPHFLLLLVVVLAMAAGCRSEGERLVDELTQTLEESATALHANGPQEERALAAQAVLEQHAVRMRIAESRLDDHVRTINDEQREALGRYAAERLKVVARLLDKEQ